MRKLVVVFLCLCVLFMCVENISNEAQAQNTSLQFDQSNVLDDLVSSVVDGKAFSVSDYPFDESKDIELLNFVEYCYSYRANVKSNYGLYIYVYNSKGLELSTDSSSNKIQMAVSYDTDGNVEDYQKFELQFLSKSEDAKYRNLFYKFKVVDGESFFDKVDSNGRRYDVSGIELLTYGQDNATEYTVGGTYIFTGYAQGFGPDKEAESTLSCQINYLETISLEVMHTFYRTETSVKGAGYQNQLDAVYFSVPQRFFDKYGTLQRIKAEWYEYKTKDIIVTSNDDFYNHVKSYVGVPTGQLNGSFIDYNEEIYYSLGQNAGDWGGGVNAAKWGWNLGDGYLHVPTPTLYYLFNVDDIEQYDPYADIVSIGGVKSNALYQYIKNYNKSFDNGTLPIKNGDISADLFQQDIDDYRKLDNEHGKIQHGYSYYDFDADVDLQKLSSWQEGNPSFWDNWINWGLWDAVFGNIPDEQGRTVSPIYVVKSGDLAGSDDDISQRLLLNSSDVKTFKNYYNNAVDNGNVVVLFRFATSDYYSSPVDIIELGKGFMWSDKHTSGQVYRAWESVFLDFDIIQLTFNNDGTYKVIPAVSNPMDIVNSVTPPVEMDDDMNWWQILFSVVCFVLLLLILFPLLPIVVSVVFSLLMLPFKAIKEIIKLFNKNK